MANLTAAEAAILDKLGDRTKGVKTAGVGTRIRNLEVNETTAQGFVLPYHICLEAGGPLVAFNDGVADGLQQMTNEEVVYTFNTSASPPEVAYLFVMPPDLDAAADVIVHILGTSSSTNDSPVVTVQAFFNTVGAAVNADANAGGDSSEFTANATFEEKTLTLALADVPDSPSHLTLLVNPKDGQLGTDDFYLAGVWLEYTKAVLTS